jgi:hypothetical protein
MFFRGAPFQRDGPGGCNLVPASPLFSTATDLVPSELTAGPQKPLLSTVSIYRPPSSGLQRRRAPNCIAPTLLTCASGLAHSYSFILSNMFFIQTLQQVHQPSRRGTAPRRGSTISFEAATCAPQRTRAIARASDLCQASTGESYSVF